MVERIDFSDLDAGAFWEDVKAAGEGAAGRKKSHKREFSDFRIRSYT